MKNRKQQTELKDSSVGKTVPLSETDREIKKDVLSDPNGIEIYIKVAIKAGETRQQAIQYLNEIGIDTTKHT